MSDTKILQTIVDGQVEIKKEIKNVKESVEDNGKMIDKLGLQLAELSDDAPTIKEFDSLEKRVNKLEKQVVLA